MRVGERTISAEVVLPVPVADAWAAWTTREGITSFFAPECRVEIRPDGPYEILFDLEAPPGSRGGEGNRVLACQPERLLAFTWNAPPHLPTVRPQRTSVVLRFSPEPGGGSRVALSHGGWGDGGEWDLAFDYFTRAWREIVFPRLARRFAEGPVQWGKAR